MPIVHFTNKFNEVPKNAANIGFEAPGFNLAVEENERFHSREFGPYANFTYETHIGLCVREYEHNTYHDSDFYMVVWNEDEAKPETICFATTRAWCYPSFASRVDATPEVAAKHKAWCEARDRKHRICTAWEARAKRVAIARAIGESNYKNLKKLDRVIPAGAGVYARTIDLLINPRIRSDFKKSLRKQILAWYFDPSPSFATPLSRKQWNYV